MLPTHAVRGRSGGSMLSKTSPRPLESKLGEMPRKPPAEPVPCRRAHDYHALCDEEEVHRVGKARTGLVSSRAVGLCRDAFCGRKKTRWGESRLITFERSRTRGVQTRRHHRPHQCQHPRCPERLPLLPAEPSAPAACERHRAVVPQRRSKAGRDATRPRQRRGCTDLRCMPARTGRAIASPRAQTQPRTACGARGGSGGGAPRGSRRARRQSAPLARAAQR